MIRLAIVQRFASGRGLLSCVKGRGRARRAGVHSCRHALLGSTHALSPSWPTNRAPADIATAVARWKGPSAI